MHFPVYSTYNKLSGITYSHYGRLYSYYNNSWLDRESTLPLHHWTMCAAAGRSYMSDSGSYPTYLAFDEVNMSDPNSPYPSINGQMNSVADLTSHGFYSIQDSTTYSAITMSMWFNCFNSGQTGLSFIAISDVQHSGGTLSLNVSANYVNNTLKFDFGGTGVTFNVKDMGFASQYTEFKTTFFSEKGYELEKWHHLAVGFQSIPTGNTAMTIAFLYYDGALISETVVTRSHLVAQEGAYWALNHLKNDSDFALEDIRIYTYRITEQELSSIYNQGTGNLLECVYNGFPTRVMPAFWIKSQEARPEQVWEVNINGLYSGNVHSGVCLISTTRDSAIVRFPEYTQNNIQIPYSYLFDSGSILTLEDIYFLNYFGVPTYDETSWSISFWLKYTSNNINLIISNIYDYLDAYAYGNFSIYMDPDVYTDLLFSYYGTSFHTITIGSLTENEWVHIALTIKNNELKAYKNGVLLFTDNTGDLPNIGAITGTYRGTTLYIGHGSGSGSIINLQDIRLFNMTLTSAEVKNIFNGDGGKYATNTVKGRLY